MSELKVGKYQAYPEYKDSGIEWIGDVPIHWQSASLSKIFSIKAGGDVKNEFFSEEKTAEHPYPIYTNANDEKSIYGYTSKCNYPPNTITVSGRGDVGFAVYRDHAYDAIIRLLVLSPTGESHGKFFAYFINKVIDFRVESSAIGQLSTQQIAPYQVTFPSFDEQQNIANFLDHETAKIDTLIEKQQQLIKLLKEKRQAVISHAVTKGLNPNAPMKDSGVEWLGEVPEHWNIAPLKYLVNEKAAGPYGASLTKAMYTTSGVKVYGQQQVISNNFTIGDYYISEDKYKEMTRYTVFSNDVLISVMGTVGKVSVVPEEAELGIINPRLVRYKFDSEKISPHFVQSLIMSQSYQSRLSESSQGSTMEGLNMGILGDLPLVFPSVDEQEKVLLLIKKETLKYSTVIAKAEEFVALSIERRTALISAAVTGKIDVRNWEQPND